MTNDDQKNPILAPEEGVDHIDGADSAQVTLVEYGDFECPGCRQAHPAVKFLRKKFGHRLRYVFRHFPLREVHPHSEMAAEAVEAAGAQDRFWAYFDKVFGHQGHLDTVHLIDYAREVGIDAKKFEGQLADHVYLGRVQRDIETGKQMGVRATPTFYVNGQLVDVSYGLDKLEDAVAIAAAPPGHQSKPKPLST